MIKAIVAVSKNGVIGQANKIPWYYPEDLKRFKTLTMESTMIMGRKTWESIGKPLPGRQSIVVTSQTERFHLSVPNATSIYDALRQAAHENVWIIGGAQIYEAGLSVCQEIDLTITPDVVVGDGLVKFPWINPSEFEVTSKTSGTNNLLHVTYTRI